jgi:hypothetical protein
MGIGKAIALQTLTLVVAGTLSLAAEPVKIESLLTDPQHYQLKSVLLRGTVHQLHALDKSLLPSSPHVQEPLTFILSDETGFIQVWVPRFVCRGGRPCPRILELADNDFVELLCHVTVEPAHTPDDFKPKVFVTTEEIRQLGKEPS